MRLGDWGARIQIDMDNDYFIGWKRGVSGVVKRIPKQNFYW
jgi:hypothetical protein